MFDPAPDPVSVTDADAIAFLESAFRNVNLPPLSGADLQDVIVGLRNFAADHLADALFPGGRIIREAPR